MTRIKKLQDLFEKYLARITHGVNELTILFNYLHTQKDFALSHVCPVLEGDGRNGGA